MRRVAAVALLMIAALCAPESGYAQKWSLGGNTGLSLLGGSPGFHVTPMAEIMFNRNIGIGTEFSLNTQYGAPLIWHPYFRYAFTIPRSEWHPFASAGPVLVMNVPNGPCFGFLFGGGASFPIAHRLSIAPNLLVGPIFGYGGGAFPLILTGYYWGIQTYGLIENRFPSTTILAFSIRAGIRYDI